MEVQGILPLPMLRQSLSVCTPHNLPVSLLQQRSSCVECGLHGLRSHLSSSKLTITSAACLLGISCCA